MVARRATPMKILEDDGETEPLPVVPTHRRDTSPPPPPIQKSPLLSLIWH